MPPPPPPQPASPTVGTEEQKGQVVTFSIATPADSSARSRSVTPHTHRKIVEITNQLDQERESRLMADAAREAMQKELDRSRKMQFELEARMQQMAQQMALLTSQSASSSSTVGTLPSAAVAPPADSPKASSEGFEVWTRKQEGDDFHDVESVTTDSQYQFVTGNEE